MKNSIKAERLQAKIFMLKQQLQFAGTPKDAEKLRVQIFNAQMELDRLRKEEEK